MIEHNESNIFKPLQGKRENDDVKQKLSRTQMHKPPKKPHNMKKRIIVAITFMFVMICAAFGYTLYHAKTQVDKTYNNDLKTSRNVNGVFKGTRPFSVLLLGTDTGSLGRSYKGRTDSIMIATINAQKKQILLTSIPRDLIVSINGHEDTFPQKMNAAYTFGSINTVADTIEDVLNVPIDAYAMVNMEGLIKTVDTVGGVAVNSPLTFQFSPESAHEYGPTMYKFTKGSSTFEVSTNSGDTWKTKTKMSGKDALAFVRMRYDDPNGDYGRVARQRLLLKSILSQSKDINNLLNENYTESVSNSVKTSLPFSDITTVASKYLPATQNIKTDALQGKTVMYQGVDYEFVDKSERQRITNKIRNSLSLEHKQTGSTFGSYVDEDDKQDFITNSIDQ